MLVSIPWSVWDRIFTPGSDSVAVVCHQIAMDLNPTFIDSDRNVPFINMFIPDGRVQLCFSYRESKAQSEVLIESFLVAGNQKLEPGRKPTASDGDVVFRCFQLLKWLAPNDQ